MPPTESTRSLPRVLLVVLGILLLARAGYALWERRHPVAKVESVGNLKRVERIQWLAPAEAAQASALHRRPILYDFTADWCGPCNRLKEEVFSEPGTAGRIASMFVPARVLDRRQEAGRNPAIVDSLQEEFQVEGFPTLLVVTPEGREVGRVLGYPGRAAVMDSLQAFHRRSQSAVVDVPSPGTIRP